MDSHFDFRDWGCWGELGNQGDPFLRVAALQHPHSSIHLGREACQFAILNPNDVGLAQREVNVEVDKVAQRLLVRDLSGKDARAPVEKALARPDQEFVEHRLFVRKMSVQRGAAHPSRPAEFFDRNPVESSFGEQVRGCVEQLLAAVCFGRCAPRLCHGAIVPILDKPVKAR